LQNFLLARVEDQQPQIVFGQEALTVGSSPEKNAGLDHYAKTVDGVA